MLASTGLALGASFPQYYWTGLGADSNFTNPANWTADGVPSGTSDTDDVNFGSTSRPKVQFLSSATLHSLIFNYPANYYSLFGGAGSPTLSLNGDISNLADSGGIEFYSSLKVALTAGSHTFSSAGANILIDSQIGETGGAASLSLTGTGFFYLYGANTFSGDMTVGTGTSLVLGSSSYAPDGISYSPVGKSTLTLQSGSTLATEAYDSNGVTLANNISLSDGVTFARSSYYYGDNELTLTGSMSVAPVDGTLTVHLNEASVFLKGTLDATGSTTITFDNTSASNWHGNFILGGTTTGNITKVIANGTGVIFGNPTAVPTTLSIQAINNGYIGVAVTNTTSIPFVSYPTNWASTVLAQIQAADRATFVGTFGFDTDESAFGEIPQTFADNLDFSAFSPTTFTLGSSSSAVLTGTITSPASGNYPFGNGGGALIVKSNLTAATGVSVISQASSSNDNSLTVILQGNNSYTGNLTIANSAVVLDSANALPAGKTVVLGTDSKAYIGYTDNFTGETSVNNFIVNRLTDYSASGDPTAILGLDSKDWIAAKLAGTSTAGITRTVSDNIDLSGLGPIYLGTLSSATLTGTIKIAASSGTLYLASASDGQLAITSPLTASGNIASVVVGTPSGSPFDGEHGTVGLISGSSTYSGGTNLLTGTLLVGASSTKSVEVITSGPLGTGALTVAPNYNGNLTLASNSLVGWTIDNPVSIGSNLTLGQATYDNYGYITAADTNKLILTGVISNPSGYYGHLVINGPTVLDGANTYSGGTEINADTTVNTNTGIGTGNVNIGNDAIVSFASLAPVIGSLGNSWINGSSGLMVLLDGSTLTINQAQDGYFSGQIGGLDVAPVITSASLVKNQEGKLTLTGNNLYNGGTTINDGVLVAGSSSALGPGSITLNSGKLSLNPGVTLTNVLTLNSGALGGRGTFSPSSAPVIGTGLFLAPGGGNPNPAGILNFGANGLTLADGGTYNWQLQSVSSYEGVGWDMIHTTGAITLPSSGQFTLKLISIAPEGTNGVISDFNSYQPYSWAVATAASFSGSTGNISINTSLFQNPLNGGFFSLSLGTFNSSPALLLNFTPVPEPSTYALILLGLGVVLLPMLRRRRR
ncbi:MAG: autotransporter-associated beta strand repeat-containing protein [Opitutaceae bacterium]|nr:autotransporter-associated beta strand repeat-containing protein [Opitutaceae bacterium]